MPLITIHSLAPADLTRIQPMLEDVRDSGAAAFGSTPLNIWVQFIPLADGHYLQSSHAPTVTIRVQIGRTDEERSALTRAVAEAVARGLILPATNVWIHYQEMRPQDVWFNGQWS